MVLIAKYMGEMVWIKMETEDNYLLATDVMAKAKKIGFPEVEKGGFEAWIPKREVVIIGDEKALGLDGILI